MDRASDSGSEGWGFESLPVYQQLLSQVDSSESLWHARSLLDDIQKASFFALEEHIPSLISREGMFLLTPDDLIVADEVMRFAQETGGIHGGGKSRPTVFFPVCPTGIQFLLLIGAEVRNIYHATTATGTVE